ncbi:MAG: sulfatase-like hydrolase/transferase [Deltaproteobacteria bacterium]|nr:sulfatase-like hydrolase/transferase [Deltaproteobacteria bacterium]
MVQDSPGKIAAWALLLTLSVSVAQLAFSGGGNFFGVDSSVLVAEILRLYPLVAAEEAFKLLAIVFVLFFVLVGATLFASRNLMGRSLFFSLAVLAYLFSLAGSVLRYPALYVEFLDEGFQEKLFHASRFLSPNILDFLASLLIGGLALYLVSRLKRRKLVFSGVGIVIAILLFSSAYGFIMRRSSASASTEASPNVLIIGIDSLRTDRVLFQIMPELFSLKMDPLTVVGEDHIVGVPRTFPSWVELVQGRYASQTGVRHMFPDLVRQRAFYPGLVSELSSLGYRTSVVSDFAGDIFPRFKAGFQDIDAPNFDLRTLIKKSVDEAFPLFLPFVANRLTAPLFTHFLENPSFSDPDLLVDKAIARLKADGPFFLSVFFSTAHFPYAAPWPWYSAYSLDTYSGPYFFKKDPDLGASQLSEGDIEQIRSLYSGSLSAVDQSLGRLFSFLKSSGVWEHTIVVVTADHGEDLFEFDNIQGHGDHLRGENVLKVPLLIKLTDKLKPAQKRLSFTSRVIDVAPTLLGFFKRALPTAQGTDLGPWILGEKVGVPAQSAYSETGIWFTRNGGAFFQRERLDYPNLSGLLNVDPGRSGSIVMSPDYEKLIIAAKHRSLTKARYKMIYTPTAKGAFFRLYDRELDPQNRKDLADELPDVFASMKGELMELILSMDRVSFVEDYVVPL